VTQITRVIAAICDGYHTRACDSALHRCPLKPGTNANSQAVEFFFPFTALRCYERYDCTGQQLIDAGTVLINGERVSLDLQIAEGGGSR
jgi:hypothetical protein